MTLRARPARPEEYDTFVRFFRELAVEQPPPPRERWDQHLVHATMFFEAPDGALAAYAMVHAFGTRGDVRQIVVDPAFRGRGLGREVMAAVRARLVEAGCTEWRLEVGATNVPAINLYSAVGMRELHELVTLRMSEQVVEQLAAKRSGRHTVVEQRPEDDAVLEDSLDLGRGQIARWRATRGNSPILRVGTTALVQLWRDFSSACGLMWPFRAPDVDVAAHLLAESAPFQAWEVGLRDAPVIRAFLAAGARLHDHQLEMGGPL